MSISSKLNLSLILVGSMVFLALLFYKFEPLLDSKIIGSEGSESLEPWCSINSFFYLKVPGSLVGYSDDYESLAKFSRVPKSF